jgi:type IV secretory pathway VirB4 component
MGKNEPICIHDQLRLRHTHILGKNGVGKSVLMETMALNDLESAHGIAVMDPHGDLIEG